MGQHIFVHALEFLPDRIVLIVRPISRKDVVGPLAEQQVAILAEQFAHRFGRTLVEEAERPAAEAKAAGRILLRPPGGLHHAIQRLEDRARELTHRRFLLRPPPRSWRRRSCASSSWRRTRAWRPPGRDSCCLREARAA